MNVLCVIPARGGSQRAPMKNVRPLCGKPLMAYTVEMALKSRLCDKVVVSTDHDRIADVAKEYGAAVVMRPAELARDTSPIDDALRHALRTEEEAAGKTFDAVVALQANVPIRKEGDIDAAVEKLLSRKDYTAVATAYQVGQRPEWMKILDPETGVIRPFMPSAHAYRMQDLPPLYLLDGAVIVLKREPLLAAAGVLKVHAYMGDRVALLVHDEQYAIEIDQEEDFLKTEFYMKYQTIIESRTA
ncbi:MAG TPA: acylneuraminate cytidylyltransferase family protein [Candidatus Omnitrophota bacterium]|nr:acylneuraminate cytidylyltransferase family protein [Candidatus Omnitrophota bacterium]HQP11421.1 acylneuraminate cytidylyltransferase family protein [Candidatus Omnitrophota bacterium]